MKRLLALLLAVIPFMPLVAQADMLPDQTHSIRNYLIVDNAVAYPTYDLYFTHDGAVLGDGTLSETPNQFFGRGPSSIIAVSKNNQSHIIHTSGGQANCGSGCFEISANKKFVITSKLSLEFSEYLPDKIPTVKTTQTVHIDSLSDTTMTLHLVSTVEVMDNGDTIDQNGSIVKNLVTTSELIAADATTQTSTAFVIGALLVTLGAIGLVVAKIWKK